MFKFLKNKIKGAVDTFTKRTNSLEDVEINKNEDNEKLIEPTKEIEKNIENKKTENEEKIKKVSKETEEKKKNNEIKNKIKNDKNIKNKKDMEVKENKTDIKEKIENEKIEIKKDTNSIKIDEEEKNKKGFFEKILAKKIDEKKFEELFFDLELILLENNVSVEVIDKIKDDLKKEIVDKLIKRGKVSETIENTLKKTIDSILIEGRIEFKNKPLIICMVGINGSGKTTTSAKLAKKFSNEGKKVVLAAADTFRAAAIDQIQEHADKLNIKLIKHQYGSDAAAVAFDAVKHAEANNIDVVIIDTAGRMHSNINLMNEIQKVVKISKPDYVFFVGESITGNDCVEQAKKFDEITKLDGIILTKADIDEKGGAALSISYVTGKPIFYLGMGQEYEDLEEFSKEKVIKNLGL